MQRYRNPNDRHAIDGGALQVGTQAENIVSEKLRRIGLSNTLMPHRHTFDILLDNGIKVDVKSSNPMKTAKTVSSQYTFRTKKYEKGRYCDFLILYLNDVNEFFVVPLNKCKGIIRFCFPEPDMGKKSMWLQYHNRFDLLERHPKAAA